ncbi:MAG: hypothetical protein QOJ90_1478 [Actinomycetota bacterium]|nr:hypothetical protein [Actinomycetota bacterium]
MSAQRWLDPAFQSEIGGWIRDRLADNGITPCGQIDQSRVRPWSTVFTVPTASAPVWCKAAGPGTAYEVALVAALGRWLPERSLVPIAYDIERAWLLLPDGGATLREASAGHTDLAHWEDILVQYAELQRLLADRATSLLSLGVPDLRPAVLPERRAALLADEPGLRLGQDVGMTRDQLSALQAQSKQYAEWCAELDAIGVAPSLQHDDLHDGNVFVPADGSPYYRVFDWGDSSVGHPFASLLVALRVVAHLHGLAPGSAELVRLRDAYLEAWTGEHDRRSLERAAALACRVGVVGRADTYRRALLTADATERDAWDEGVYGWLLEDGAALLVGPGGAD